MTTLADKSLLSGSDNKPPMLEKHLYDSLKSWNETYMTNRPHGRMILASIEKANVPSKALISSPRPPIEIYDLVINESQFLNTLPDEWSKFVTDVKLVKDLHTTNVDQLHAYLEQHERHANEVRLMHELEAILENRGRLFATTAKGRSHFQTYGTKPRKRIIPWFKGKVFAGQAQALGQIPNELLTADDLDAYNSDCDELNLPKLLSWRIYLIMVQMLLLRITTTTEVPLRKSSALDNKTPKPVVTLVYSRKPKFLQLVFLLTIIRSSKLSSSIWTLAAPSI
ncbi:hypothetical protein Tco_0993219 [Tanacetum coccineum]|uniref:SPX domain-containing protein n=1 Tax=Tanacetum coccineum TaxID=301880 RepID=A0ABQ5F4I6_9ASTR